MPEVVESTLTAESIVTKVNKFRSTTDFDNLRQRWEKDFDLWRLATYDPGKGYLSYTTNSPKNLSTKAISMLNSARLTIRVPDETLDMIERETANNMERLLYGSINMVDERMARIDEPSIHSQICWNLIVRGSVAVRILVGKEPDGSTYPNVSVWDMYDVAYGVGRDGLTWACRYRMASRDEVKDEYGIDIGRDADWLYDFWDTKENTVMCNGKWLKSPTIHGEDYCPVFIIKAGAQPTVSKGQNFQYPNTFRGDSVFSSNRNLYPVLSKTISDYVTIIHRGVKVPLGYWSAGGKATLDKDIWQVESAAVVPMDSMTNEKIAPLITPTMPADAKTLLEFVMNEEQLGGISHVAMGQLGFRLSGFAINQLQGALATIINPFVEAVERTYVVICKTILSQYAKGSWTPMKVRGRNSKKQAFGVAKPVTINPEEIEPDWKLEVKLNPVYPKDDAQRYELARLATGGNSPLLSIRTAMEEIIGVEDVDFENSKKDLEFSKSLPLVKMTEAYMAAVDDKDYEKAKAIQTELKRMLQSQQPQQGRSSGGRSTMPKLSQESMENPGTGVPSGETGLSSETMPPESMGGFPSGASEGG